MEKLSKEGYRYLGNYASMICPNGHFGVSVQDPNCKVCGEKKFDLIIRSRVTSLVVTVVGFFVKRAGQHHSDVNIKYAYDNSRERVSFTEFCKDFYIDGANSILAFSRMESWNISNGK